MELEEARDRADRILNRLSEEYGVEPWNWHTKQAPFQVLIGTVLSHRTRDENTDKASQALLAAYPDAASIAEAPLEQVEALIRPANFYKTKAKRIKDICQILLERHQGAAPQSMDELLKLPGVGRKTANCVLVYGFRIPSIPVDAHVHRIPNRLGILCTKTPDETEQELMRIVPERHLLYVNELFVKHGQTICKPVGPACYGCSIVELCEYEPKNLGAGKGRGNRNPEEKSKKPRAKGRKSE